MTIGLGANPALRANLGSVGTRFGRLLRMLPNGRTEYAEDLADYEADANPDGGAHDSNPYGIAVLPSRTLYADAGGNAVNEVAANGDISTFAVFPNRTVPSPFPPPGSTLTMQAVPTTVVEGPDGWIYIGQLTGFPFPIGGARVYRVPPEGGTPQVYADGFTNIIDIAFGADGSLYVLEIDSTSLRLGDSTGALIKIAPNGTRTTIASAGMIMPGGVAIARDGGIYVTLFSVFPGGGQVVRVNP